MRAAPEIAGQRSTSTDQPEREFARAVAASELCDDGLRGTVYRTRNPIRNSNVLSGGVPERACL